MSRSKKSKFTPSSSFSQTDFKIFLKNPALEDILLDFWLSNPTHFMIWLTLNISKTLCFCLITVLIMSRSKKSKFTPSSSSSQTDFRVFLKNLALKDDYLRISQLEILRGRFVSMKTFMHMILHLFFKILVFVQCFQLNLSKGIISFWSTSFTLI